MTAREPAIASAAADWLEATGLEVYEEVQSPDTYKRADLVGVGAQALVVVECKVGLTGYVIQQARNWLPYCNASWVAFGGTGGKRPRVSSRLLAECRAEGIGVLCVYPDSDHEPRIVLPALVRDTLPAHDSLRDALDPDQRRGVGAARAGSNGGGYHTPFRATVKRIAEIVAGYPDGIDVEDLLPIVKQSGGHHYRRDRSFVASIPGHVKAGRVPGVRLVKTFGRKATMLRPVERTDA